MDWKRVKNILILLLLATNCILAYSIYSQFTERDRAETQSVLSALQLAGAELSLSESDILALPREIYSLRVTRANSLEDNFARELLGEGFSSESGGGGIYRYTGQNGSGEIKRGGEIEFSLSPPDAANAAEYFAQRVSAALAVLAGTEQTAEGIVFRQSYDGLVILNYTLLCTANGVSGHWLISESWARIQRAPSRAELVIRLASVLNERGVQAAKSVKCGYYVENTGGQDSLALPVWMVETDGVTLVFDLIGGKIIE